MSRSDLVPLLADPDENEMEEINPTEERNIRSFPASNCPRSVCGGPLCECENCDADDIEQAPLISYHSDTPNNACFTDFHCHGFRPIFSNKKARTKLMVASSVCLVFVVAEVVAFIPMDETPKPAFRGPLFPANNCINGSCGGSACLCGNAYDEEADGGENAPLISYQSATQNDTYFTDVHCHEFRPIFSNKNARRKLTIASIVCLFFVIAEVIGGLLAHSLAIMTDAAHMLSDFAAFLISLFAIWVAKWQPDKKRTFGYYRAEVLGALVSVLIIWVLTGVLVYLAVQRVLTRDFEINADIMIITAGIALAINILLGIILHQAGVPHGHSHNGGGSHSHSFKGSINHSHSTSVPLRSRSGSIHEKENINVRAAFIHVLGDIVQSVGVLIAAYIIKYKPTWKLADPICTFLFSVLVLITTLNIVRDTIHVLMEGTPKNINYNAVKAVLENIQGVVAAHSLHIWSLTVNKAALAVHLAVAPGTDTQKVLNIAHQKLKTEFQIFHSTIQVEYYQESVMTNCDECQDLKD